MNHLFVIVMSMFTREDGPADRDRGATATEYALLVAFIAIVIVAGVTLFGSQLNAFFSSIGSQVGILS